MQLATLHELNFRPSQYSYISYMTVHLCASLPLLSQCAPAPLLTFAKPGNRYTSTVPSTFPTANRVPSPLTDSVVTGCGETHLTFDGSTLHSIAPSPPADAEFSCPIRNFHSVTYAFPREALCTEYIKFGRLGAKQQARHITCGACTE